MSAPSLTWRIDAIDPATAPEAELAAVHALEVSLEQEALPDEPTPPLAHFLVEYRRVPSFRHRRWWVGRARSGEVVGWAMCAWDDLPENRSHCWANVQVAGPARRRGLGSALLGRAVASAREWGATLFDLEARVGGPGEAFLRGVGAELRQVERRSVLRRADLDRHRLEGWVERARERAGAYSLVGWDGPCPEEWLGAFCDLKAVMNTAPLDALERDDDHHTPAQWREREATLEAQGFDTWTLCALYDPSTAPAAPGGGAGVPADAAMSRQAKSHEHGTAPAAPGGGAGVPADAAMSRQAKSHEHRELAGLTELVFPRRWPEMCYQEDTGVWPKHRGRGLGRWLKAALALRLLDERPDVSQVETWNAGSNRAMLAINTALGFRPLEDWGAWQAPVEGVEAALARSASPAA